MEIIVDTGLLRELKKHLKARNGFKFVTQGSGSYGNRR